VIPYIGCVSREDAEVLRLLAERADRILEFGSGASTQIFRAYCTGAVYSVETDPEWIHRTLRNLHTLGLSGVEFQMHDCFEPSGEYGVIFIDNADELRVQSALNAWPYLAADGVMAFHDTRRTKAHGLSETSDVQNVCAIIQRFSPEIDSVTLNAMDSNTTLVCKREPLLYENWQATEGRTDAEMGL
jgi:predicted O-methyltransferase YrrM